MHPNKSLREETKNFLKRDNSVKKIHNRHISTEMFTTKIYLSYTIKVAFCPRYLWFVLNAYCTIGLVFLQASETEIDLI
jgi:hypothetical protein